METKKSKTRKESHKKIKPNLYFSQIQIEKNVSIKGKNHFKRASFYLPKLNS